MTIEDVNFVDTDTESIKSEIIAKYEEVSGRSLAQADPIRLFLETIAALIVKQRVLINYTGKMNLLAYATGSYLDHIGALVGTSRIQATAATAHFQITLSDVRPTAITVPKGTRISPANDIYFALNDDVIILAGETIATAEGTCLTTGTSGNGFAVGEIEKIVDPVAYVDSIISTTISDGGADTESDESFRERIREAPEKYSTAGSRGAYEYWTKTASALISDVAVVSPTPGEVDVYPLLTGGVLPTEEIISDVLDVLSDEKVRPLTDNVKVLSPTMESYDLDITYYIDDDDKAQESTIKKAVEAAIDDWILWQRSKMGRDVNPTELYYSVRNAGAKRAVITSPAFTVVADTSLAAIGTKSITYGGLEDG